MRLLADLRLVALPPMISLSGHRLQHWPCGAYFLPSESASPLKSPRLERKMCALTCLMRNPMAINRLTEEGPVAPPPSSSEHEEAGRGTRFVE